MKNKKNLLSIGKAAEYLNISIDTLRRWEKKGKLESYRSPGNHRYFLKEDLDKLFGKKYQHDTPRKKRKERKVYDEPTTKNSNINENNEKIEKDISKITPTYTPPTVYPFSPNLQEKVLDRPSREVKIPEVELIRVIQEKKIEVSKNGISESKREEVESSILTPTNIDKVPEEKPQEVAPKKTSKLEQGKTREDESTSEVIKNNLLIYAVITVTILIVIATIFFFVGVTSQKMITPVP